MYSLNPNPKWGNFHFKKVCGHEWRTLRLLQLGAVAWRPAVQMAWAIHLVSLPSSENRWGNTSCQEKGYSNHWIILLALFIDIGCWEGWKIAFGIRQEEGVLLSNPSDSFSSLDFWIGTWQIQQVPSLSLRQGRVAAKTGQCTLFLWFPWMLDIARYCCRGQSILVWQSKRKAVTLSIKLISWMWKEGICSI